MKLNLGETNSPRIDICAWIHAVEYVILRFLALDSFV